MARKKEIEHLGIKVKKCQLYIGGNRWVKRWYITEDGLPIQDINLFLLDKASESFSTAEKYAYVIATYLRYLKKFKIHYLDANTELLKRYVRDLLLTNNSNPDLISSQETQLSYAALKTRLNGLANFYDSLITMGKVSLNPIVRKGEGTRKSAEAFLDGIVNPKKREKTIVSKKLKYKETRHWLKWYTTQEIEDICSAFRSFRDKVIFLISIETGMRIGEILGLKVSSFNYRERTLFVSDIENPENDTSAKTGERTVPISHPLAAAIVHYLEGERNVSSLHNDSIHHYLFINQQGPTKGKAMSTRNYLDRLKTAGISAGFRRSELRTHSGRSTTIQRLLDLVEQGVPGVSNKFLEEILGLHESSFKHYKKPFEARVSSKMAETLNNLTPLNDIKVIRAFTKN